MVGEEGFELVCESAGVGEVIGIHAGEKGEARFLAGSFESTGDALFAGRVETTDGGMVLGEVFYEGDGGIGAAVGDDEDFIGRMALVEQGEEAGFDGLLGVAGSDDGGDGWGGGTFFVGSDGAECATGWGGGPTVLRILVGTWSIGEGECGGLVGVRKGDEEGSAADFAVVIELAGSFVGRGLGNKKGLPACGALDRNDLH